MWAGGSQVLTGVQGRLNERRNRGGEAAQAWRQANREVEKACWLALRIKKNWCADLCALEVGRRVPEGCKEPHRKSLGRARCKASSSGARLPDTLPGRTSMRLCTWMGASGGSWRQLRQGQPAAASWLAREGGPGREPPEPLRWCPPPVRLATSAGQAGAAAGG